MISIDLVPLLLHKFAPLSPRNYRWLQRRRSFNGCNFHASSHYKKPNGLKYIKNQQADMNNKSIFISPLKCNMFKIKL